MVTMTQSAVIPCLQRAQANAIVSYLNAKRYHWFPYGPHFRDLHLFWDEVAAAASAEIDPLGERLRMLGGEPVSEPAAIERTATIRVARGHATPRAMLEEALLNERRIIDEMRDGARIADEQNDPGTNDLFANLVQTHEKYAWFIEEFLRHDDSMAV
jgi:starvation-inducible DNA-binding protein